MESVLYWYGFHSFLHEYIRKNRCKRILEIGVFNGDNALSMVEAAVKASPPEEVEYYGFDFFESSMLHQVELKLGKTGCKFKLFRGDTLDSLPRAVKSLPKMDLIFIDGGKSYREASSDWECSKTLMHEKTAVFVHNYEFSGVHRMVDSIPRDEYQVEIIHPPNDSDTAFIKSIQRSIKRNGD